MPFEDLRPEEKDEKIGQTSEKIGEVLDTVDIDTLERAIRFLEVGKRDKLYTAVEKSKTATDDLMHTK